MAEHYHELLTAARILYRRRSGQRGKLPSARIRRSISTTYYALFHFMLAEVGAKMLGAAPGARRRRRLLGRTISHQALQLTFKKLAGQNVESSVEPFFRVAGTTGAAVPPRFVRDMARAFLDAQTKRLNADYDLEEPFGEQDARVLRLRVKRVIRMWCAANSLADRDFKRAVCTLIVLRGQLRSETSTGR